MGESILTLHPEGKAGVNIDRTKYDLIRRNILSAIHNHQEIGFKELTVQVEQRLEGQFDGSLPWYVITVKLDLEARGVVKRVAGKGPHKLRLAES